MGSASWVCRQARLAPCRKPLRTGCQGPWCRRLLPRRRRVAAPIVSLATYKRTRRLSPAAGERAERLARVTALAQQALGDADDARTWLTTPHPWRAERTPIETAATDLGTRLVERILHNIEYSLPV